jgi:hypothetical protein
MTARRASISAGLLSLILAALLLFYGTALGAFAYVKWNFRNSPGLWIVPRPLPLALPDRAAGARVSYFGYEFDSPSAEFKEERKVESVVVLSFSNCAGIVIFKPDPAGDLVHILQLEASKRGGHIEDVFGWEGTRSNYALLSKELNLTPGDVRLFSSRREIIANYLFLNLKNINSQRFKNGLYSFETPWIRGFQEGDLVRDRGVVIEAFDQQDRRLMLIIGAKPGTSCFAQSDLNRIISSVRPVPSGQ